MQIVEIQGLLCVRKLVIHGIALSYQEIINLMSQMKPLESESLMVELNNQDFSLAW